MKNRTLADLENDKILQNIWEFMENNPTLDIENNFVQKVISHSFNEYIERTKGELAKNFDVDTGLAIEKYEVFIKKTQEKREKFAIALNNQLQSQLDAIMTQQSHPEKKLEQALVVTKDFLKEKMWDLEVTEDRLNVLGSIFQNINTVGTSVWLWKEDPNAIIPNPTRDTTAFKVMKGFKEESLNHMYGMNLKDAIQYTAELFITNRVANTNDKWMNQAQMESSNYIDFREPITFITLLILENIYPEQAKKYLKEMTSFYVWLKTIDQRKNWIIFNMNLKKFFEENLLLGRWKTYQEAISWGKDSDIKKLLLLLDLKIMKKAEKGNKEDNTYEFTSEYKILEMYIKAYGKHKGTEDIKKLLLTDGNIDEDEDKDEHNEETQKDREDIPTL